MIVKYFLRPLHQLLGLGNTAFDMLKADGIDKAVTDALIYHEFHIQIGFAAKAAFSIKLVNRFLASDGAEIWWYTGCIPIEPIFVIKKLE